ncbi:porin family protein [Rhodoblastus acidophilus]|uniref:Porin family protein n=1 Tax=Candidatus Rhodoblastus alkanivorans TaxID=2954117 RepID=A0ABS9Z578_9HYPH|nr:outer membrane protein [Candidatus Rhodoblastus alkanivorans]MCI4677642.1 porin family protein [Candidatus Rhodoblastus alkanivorans]MCI4682626.1 porin family protein [Candidatus Rhodoblastus alkanivorans]MDI4639932.1 porin family protein [Rhodoblastus acidophilus]
MKKVSIALIGGAAICFASLAQAADLPYGAAASNYDYPSTFTWSGFYAGLNAGAGFGNFNGSGQAYLGSSPSGWLMGATVGYNYQQGNLLIGAEGDYDWSRIASDASVAPGVASTGIIQNLATIRGRVGYAMDRILVFGTGGYAGGDIRGVLNNIPAHAVADQSYWANGWTLGLGAEYAITPHITAKAEYLYASLGSNDYFNSTPNYMSAGANVNILRAGLNYKF